MDASIKLIIGIFLFVLLSASFATTIQTTTWPFTNASDYAYNASLINVSGGVAKLITPSIFLSPYALWHLNEVSGTNIADSSGNGRNGTTVNSPTWVTAKLNNGLNLTGTQYGNMGDIASFERTDPFSVELWIKTTDTAGTLISRTVDDTRGWNVLYAGGILYFRLSNNGSTNMISVQTSFTLSDDAWHHVAVTYNGNSLASGVNIYIDGSLKSLTTQFNTLTATTIISVNTTLGARSDNTNNMNGIYDEVAIYNKTLSATEVAFRYNSGNGTESIGNYDTSNPTIAPNTPINATPETIYSWENFTENATKPAGSNINYILSNDNSTWKYWNGTTWAISDQSYAQSSNASTIDSNFATFTTTNNYLIWKSFLNSNGLVTPELDALTINYTYQIRIYNESYTPVITKGSTNTFTWVSNNAGNSTLRIWNTSLGYDDTNTNSSLATSHSLSSDVINATGIYNFNISSQDSTGIAYTSGTFSVVDVGIDYDLNYTLFMRNETIDSTVNADELRINYTEGGVLTLGKIIKCWLNYPDGTIAKSEITMNDLGTGWYNYTNFYRFNTSDPAGTYQLNCNETSNPFLKTQNINLYSTGTANATAIARDWKTTCLNYTFNLTLINIRGGNDGVAIGYGCLDNDGSDSFGYTTSANNTYAYNFTYAVYGLNRTLNHILFNYLESLNITNVSSAMQYTEIDWAFLYYFENQTNLNVTINSSYSPGAYALKGYGFNTSLSDYAYNQTTITVTNQTYQNVSYNSTHHKDMPSDANLCLDSINLLNARNDTGIAFTWNITSGYGSNGTCLINVTNQTVGIYNFSISTYPTDGLNAMQNITYTYSVSVMIPVVTLLSPMNNSNYTVNPTFIFNMTADHSPLSCKLELTQYVPIVYYTASTSTNTTVLWTINTTLNPGNWTWRIYCIDGNLTGTSETRQFRITTAVSSTVLTTNYADPTIPYYDMIRLGFGLLLVLLGLYGSLTYSLPLMGGIRRR